MVCHAGVNCEDKLLHFHEMLHAARATYSFLTDKSDVWPTRGKDGFCRHTTGERRISGAFKPVASALGRYNSSALDGNLPKRR